MSKKPGIRIHILTNRDSISDVSRDWEQLIEGSAAEVLSSPNWCLAWLDANQVSQIAIFCAYQESQLVGVLPMALHRTDAKGLFLNVVAPIAPADYQPAIVTGGVQTGIIQKMLGAAFEHFRHVGTISWPNIPSEDPANQAILEFCESNGMRVYDESEIAPRLSLDGRDFDEVEKAWTANHRGDVRRRYRRIQELGDTRLWEPKSLREAESAIMTFFDVHDEKWLASGFPGQFQSPSVRKHFLALAKRFWSKGLHFTTVRCGEVDVSFHFGFLAGGWVQWYRPSYRSDFGRYSPGKVHLYLLTKMACDKGWKGIDFLLGEESYKGSWANEKITVNSLWIGPGSPSLSFWWFSVGRPYFKRKLAYRLLRAKAFVQNLGRAK